jgi:two-component system sensor histidine kinase/response regulator
MDNLLNWSRIQLNNINPYFSGFSIKEILRSNLKFLDGHITQKKISVRIPQFDDVKVYADSDMISVIIRNLLSNAIKYSYKEGTIEINGTRGNDNYFVLSIRDEGIGMNHESIGRIFSMKKVSSVQGTNNELGSGLGLILCQEFTLMNNCKLSVESEKGKGSKFTLKIPLVK